MKYIPTLLALWVFTACDDDIRVVNMRVNHFMQSGVGVSPELLLLTQEADQIGTDDWHLQYVGISGFDYEWGYFYDLSVGKKEVDDPPADASSIEFILEEVLSKTQVGEDVTFEIILKDPRGIQNIVIENDALEYSLLGGIQIDCPDLCEQMAELLSNEEEVTGVFTHGSSGTIVLEELKVK